jgi:TonB family protein
MFDTYVLDRRANSSRGGWFATSLIFATTVIVGVMVALVIYSWWQISRVEPKYQSISFLPVLLPPEPPPAAAAPPPLKPKDASNDKVQKDKTKIELVQLDKDIEKKPDQTVDPTATPEGDVNGVTNGKVGGTGIDPNGVLGGDPKGCVGCTGTVVEEDPCADPVKAKTDERCKPPETKNIPLEAIAARRTAGREQIPLSNDVKIRAVRDNNRRFTIAVKLCLDTAGVPDKIELAKSSGYAEADAAVLAEMRNWRFQPYTVNDKAVRVCTAYLYQYVIEQ